MSTTSERVLFKIYLDTQLKTKPFADITDLSLFHREREVLIMLGALFRIDGVARDVENQLWVITLTLADEDEYELKDTFAHLRNEIHEETNLASLGKILCEMGLYDQGEEIYQKMERDTRLDLSMAIAGKGKVAFEKNKYDTALECELRALSIKMELNVEEVDLAISYSRLNNTSEALTNLKKALELQEKHLELDSLNLAKTYQRIALIYDQMQDCKLALDYLRKALKIRQIKLPENSTSLAATYHEIGKLFYRCQEFIQAFEFYQKALEIYEKILVPNHTKLLKLREDITSNELAASESYI